MRCAHNAAIGSEAGQDKRRCSQVMQQYLQRRLEKSRMHRLEYEVIVVVRLKREDEWSARTTRYQAAVHQALRIRTPLAEIIVNVDGGNTCMPAPTLEFGQTISHWQCVFQDLITVGELEMIDDVNEDECHG